MWRQGQLLLCTTVCLLSEAKLTVLCQLILVLSAAQMVGVFGKLYVFGGVNADYKVREYNPATKQWTTKNDMKTLIQQQQTTPRRAARAVVI